ncbi:MAG TPA: hypothetical protein VJT49_24005 [Amycolatopsis sp.]|uniref:hypothetical protein n=1 Tax=Amycolatopsis sp. TaxID=37632 RepID=UPI002B46BC71|nr:hypothetical protein [Amycolatopsis sp.]HKS48117.1 hypothetical protein [Amycolatopsis sp.]
MARKKQPLDEEVREAFESVLEDFAKVSDSTDALDVELLVSGSLGSWWHPGQPEQVNRLLGFPLISCAARTGTRAGLGLLRGMQALGVTGEQRERARAAADRLAAEGVSEPAWEPMLREVTVTECWQEADVYGDRSALLLICDRAGRRHGLVVKIDFNGDGLTDAFLTAEPDAVLSDLRGNKFTTTGQVSLPRARRIIEDAIETNDFVLSLFDKPQPADPLTEPRAYLMARLRAMPPAEPHPEPHPEPTTYSDADRDDIVRQFFAETDANDDPDARELARYIVDHGCDEDAGRPLRVGPRKFAIIVGDIEHTPDLHELIASLPDVLTRWARWAGAKSGLSEAAVERLLEAVEEIIEDLDEPRYDDWDDDEFDFDDEFEPHDDVPIALRGNGPRYGG